MSDFSEKNIKQLCEEQIRKYMSKLRRVENGEKGDRVKDLEYYISLWKDIAVKKYIFNALTISERNEIIKAMKKDDYIVIIDDNE